MTQGSLFPMGTASRECSVEALETAKDYAPEILRLLEIAGHDGHTTRELAEIIGCEPGSLTAAICRLANSEQIRVLAEKRRNKTGRRAAINVLRCWAEERPIS